MRRQRRTADRRAARLLRLLQRSGQGIQAHLWGTARCGEDRGRRAGQRTGGLCMQSGVAGAARRHRGAPAWPCRPRPAASRAARTRARTQCPPGARNRTQTRRRAGSVRRSAAQPARALAALPRWGSSAMRPSRARRPQRRRLARHAAAAVARRRRSPTVRGPRCYRLAACARQSACLSARCSLSRATCPGAAARRAAAGPAASAGCAASSRAGALRAAARRGGTTCSRCCRSQRCWWRRWRRRRRWSSSSAGWGASPAERRARVSIGREPAAVQQSRRAEAHLPRQRRRIDRRELASAHCQASKKLGTASGVRLWVGQQQPR